MPELNDQNDQPIVVEDHVFAAASAEESVDCSVGHGAQYPTMFNYQTL